MNGVHHLAVRGFGRAADAYERGRPGYPAEAVDLLVQELGLDAGSRVVDVAAGTGKLTRLLAGTGARVVAVEPLEAMGRKLAETVPGVPVVAATAEAIPIRDGWADGVAVAQAFHWFDGERALPELHRVLRPGGGLAVVWNIRDRSPAWVRDFYRVIAPHEEGAPRYRYGEWRRPFEQSDLFEPLEERRFPNPQEGDPETFLAQVASMSIVSSLPEGDRARVLREVAKMLERHPETSGERLVIPFETAVYWARRRL